MKHVTVSLLKHLSPILCISIPADAQVYIKFPFFFFFQGKYRSYMQCYGYNGGDTQSV